MYVLHTHGCLTSGLLHVDVT